MLLFVNDICYWKLVYFNTSYYYLYLLADSSYPTS